MIVMMLWLSTDFKTLKKMLWMGLDDELEPWSRYKRKEEKRNFAAFYWWEIICLRWVYISLFPYKNTTYDIWIDKIRSWSFTFEYNYYAASQVVFLWGPIKKRLWAHVTCSHASFSDYPAKHCVLLSIKVGDIIWRSILLIIISRCTYKSSILLSFYVNVIYTFYKF